MSKRTVFFTHIPKTAGSSLHKTVFGPSLPSASEKRPKGLRDLITDGRTYRYVHGHMPYGYHRFISMSGPPLYFVVLRDPVERAISQYYNILHPGGNKEVPDHPDYETARKYTLNEFYRLPRFQNEQPRMVAGVTASRLGRYVDLNEGWMGDVVLERAKHNLQEAYDEVGLTERFDEMDRRFAARLDGEYEPSDKRYKFVPDRPTAEDLDAEMLESLKSSNRLDLALYDVAQDIFEQRT
ncbi:hypothetical protein GGP66_000218 [Salinibacter ruber]|uniref:sulfotransferase family protein n=1 Tax=Salinibacter ruber TaxID=146919 RepID=UPI002169E84C|nr:sulfotransferase family protein [Salinibacter ruber]MCS3672814.1 hypothetical protein [Salinibacter ruber]